MPLKYCNPVHDDYFADPFVMKVDDGYVAIGTGRVVGELVFEVLVSDDLVTWARRGGALKPPAGVGTDFWAPEVAYFEGQWYLFYSAGVADAHHHIRVAIASQPTGPYTDQGLNLTPDERFAIDPHPFRGEDGEWYLFFARDVLEGERVGTMLAVDRLVDMTALAGTPTEVLRPSGDWQIYQRERSMYDSVYDWHTLEGPFVCRHDDRYWCFYSGGSWLQPTYAVGYAVADHPLGPWTEPTGAQPLLRTVPDHVIGPGHNSVVAAPDGTDVLVYHAWDPEQTARRMCIDPIRWTPDGPVTDGPTYQPTTLPR
jgi:arabinan endo-1,5-alpha-L-arabinosidase